ncbi:MAG: hypothetical protein KGJ07_02325 [Patescibacteria group bacterium]|nr:hypothetical protein [Patescibacteria group bacterium]MDE2589321.1 hypothetical protein [Patescibacteria group bacterium]
MVNKIAAGIATGTMLSLVLAGSAFANTSPNGPGQPGAPGTTCQQYTITPGNAANGQSPFNPNGQSGSVYAGNPGTASLEHSNNTHAVSQYDVACFQQTSH